MISNWHKLDLVLRYSDLHLNLATLLILFYTTGLLSFCNNKFCNLHRRKQKSQIDTIYIIYHISEKRYKKNQNLNIKRDMDSCKTVFTKIWLKNAVAIHLMLSAKDVFGFRNEFHNIILDEALADRLLWISFGRNCLKLFWNNCSKKTSKYSYKRTCEVESFSS